MKIEDKYLPESCYGSDDIVPQAIVLHYISAINVDPDNPFDMDKCRKILEDYSFSYHYMIGREGELWQLAPETKRAFHAGKSEYKGKTNWNQFSIGLCFIGTDTSGFTDDQYDEGKRIISWLIDQFPIRDIVGHEDIARSRGKIDPGISTGNFDLSRVLP